MRPADYWSEITDFIVLVQRVERDYAYLDDEIDVIVRVLNVSPYTIGIICTIDVDGAEKLNQEKSVASGQTASFTSLFYMTWTHDIIITAKSWIRYGGAVYGPNNQESKTIRYLVAPTDKFSELKVIKYQAL